ncbi:hypothetical protein [Helicobacter sp. MIT 05-5294]|uniref:hypothetical protein n=1 Tax=Helicobacter sp. MIT 05-5294 TaxID=1548150 RepID=UPI0010FEE2BD|nr:hypothetical protein [Helicobacter sp. MIT 05-5294]TLD88215.1 hypothetical protein LS69_002875 [Helicobacter sp. MIT 05-5294]
MNRILLWCDTESTKCYALALCVAILAMTTWKNSLKRNIMDLHSAGEICFTNCMTRSLTTSRNGKVTGFWVALYCIFGLKYAHNEAYF